jgi:hypothetical protein
MEKIRTFQRHELNKIRKQSTDSGLEFEKFGRSSNIMDYSDRELNEMILGIYRDSKHLKVDEGYFIDVSNVQKVICVLKDISYSRRMKLQPKEVIKLQDIRNFYVTDYFLETIDKFENTVTHKITDYLRKVGGISLGKGKYNQLYSIPNDFKTFYNGIPVDLFYPIQNYINGLFFDDDYYISNFELIASFSIIE